VYNYLNMTPGLQILFQPQRSPFVLHYYLSFIALCPQIWIEFVVGNK
jgi:hypothetical protein